MNIVESLLKLLGGSVGKQLASLLGIGEDKAESVVKAALPALLAALTGVASTKEGAEKLALAVEGADDEILGNPGSILGRQGSTLADKGNSVLGSLLPGGLMGNLTSVLEKFTGLGSGSMTTLLGSLVPIVLGLLKRETKVTGYDPTSLTRLLEGQKENIADALPDGLGAMLGGIPGLGSIISLAQGNRETLGSATNLAATTARSAATAGAGAARWVVPLVIAFGLGLLAWNYWFKPQESQPVVNRAPTTPTTVTVAKISNEIARQVTTATADANDIFADLQAALSSVTDADSTEQAAIELPKLTDRLVELKKLTNAIPDFERKPILEMIAKSRGTLLTLVETIVKIPSVSTILAPHVEQLRAALDTFDE